MSGCRLPTLILFIALLVTGCAKGVKLESTAYEKRPSPKPFSKIMVVGITPNQGIRVRWEDLMARTLRDAGNTAWSSFRDVNSPVIDPVIFSVDLPRPARSRPSQPVFVSSLMLRGAPLI